GDLRLECAEVVLAALVDQRRNGAAGPLLDFHVEVDETPVEPTGEGSGHAALAGAHEADEHDALHRCTAPGRVGGEVVVSHRVGVCGKGNGRLRRPRGTVHDADRTES